MIIWFNKVVQVYINLNDPSPGSEKRKLLLKLLYNYASKTHRSAKNGVPNFRTVAQCLLQWTDGESTGKNTSNIFHAALTHE